MNITTNQLMRMLFLLAWAIEQSQALPSNSASTRESSTLLPIPITPGEGNNNDDYDYGDRNRVLAQRLMGGFFIGLPLLVGLYIFIELFRLGFNPTAPRQRLTHAYDGAVLGDIELQPIPSLATTPGINATLKTFIEVIDRSALKPSRLAETQVTRLEREHPELCCSITESLMEIPVTLDQRKYDLISLLALRENIDPTTRSPFQLAEISRDYLTRGKIVEAIQTLTSRADEGSSLVANAM
jgi:hypothetical protein